MEYKKDLGDYEVTFTGTPEEIAKLVYLLENELVVVDSKEEQEAFNYTKEMIEEMRGATAFMF